jgi:hypothetical protein
MVQEDENAAFNEVYVWGGKLRLSFNALDDTSGQLGLCGFFHEKGI